MVCRRRLTGTQCVSGHVIATRPILDQVLSDRQRLGHAMSQDLRAGVAGLRGLGLPLDGPLGWKTWLTSRAGQRVALSGCKMLAASTLNSGSAAHLFRWKKRKSNAIAIRGQVIETQQSQD